MDWRGCGRLCGIRKHQAEPVGDDTLCLGSAPIGHKERVLPASKMDTFPVRSLPILVLPLRIRWRALPPHPPWRGKLWHYRGNVRCHGLGWETRPRLVYPPPSSPSTKTHANWMGRHTCCGKEWCPWRCSTRLWKPLKLDHATLGIPYSMTFRGFTAVRTRVIEGCLPYDFLMLM